MRINEPLELIKSDGIFQVRLKNCRSLNKVLKVVFFNNKNLEVKQNNFFIRFITEKRTVTLVTTKKMSKKTSKFLSFAKLIQNEKFEKLKKMKPQIYNILFSSLMNRGKETNCNFIYHLTSIEE